MTKHSKKKKTLLGSGIALTPTATTLLVNGRYIEGALVGAVAIGFIVGYDYLDDKVKGTPELPEGVDTETITDAADDVAETIKNGRQ